MTDTTTPIPATPEPAHPTGSRLGWRAEQRPRPGFAHTLGAMAGVFAVVAVIAFIVEAAGDDPTAPGVIFTLVLIAAAWAMGARVPGPLRSAATAVLVLAIPVLWLFAFAGGGTFGRGAIRGVLLLTLASYLLLSLVGWTRGRGVFIAGTLLVLTSWLSFEVAGSSSSQIVPFQGQISSSTSTSLGTSTTDSLSGDSTSAAAAVVMLLGLSYLAFAAAFDSRRWAGLATPFIGVGAYATVSGAVALGADDSTLAAGLLAIVAGLIVGFVASRGENRRATTWIGALTVLVGMAVIIGDIAPSSAAGVGGIAAGFALALGAVAMLLAPRLGEPADGAPEPEVPASPEPT